MARTAVNPAFCHADGRSSNPPEGGQHVVGGRRERELLAAHIVERARDAAEVLMQMPVHLPLPGVQFVISTAPVGAAAMRKVIIELAAPAQPGTEKAAHEQGVFPEMPQSEAPPAGASRSAL